jgi:hypothetical protein
MLDRNVLLVKLLNAQDDDPCICMSGKKFKDCHKLFINKEIEHPAKIVSEILRTSIKKQCLFGKGSDCDGEIIKAHSISRKYLCSMVDETNHVYSFINCIKFPIIKELYTSEMLPDPEKIGINDVSTFHGLCSKHDRELFSSFELGEFNNGVDQIKAMHLRSILKEIYAKTNAINTTSKAQRGISKVDKTSYSITRNHSNLIMQLGNNLALRDLFSEFSMIRESINTSSEEEFKYVSFKIKGECPISCSSIPNPAFDLFGNIIQNYNDESIFTRSFSINVFPESRNEFYYVLGWFKSETINNFMISLKERSSDYLLQYLIQLVFGFSENSAINIKWFDSLSIIKRERLKKIFWKEIKNQDSGQSTHLEYRSHEFYTGSIINIVTNIGIFA